MQFDFSQAMAERSDAELIAITTTEKDNYQAVALEAARVELSRRNLSAHQIETAIYNNSRQEQLENKKRDKPLEAYWKILVFFIPTIALLIIAGYLKSHGSNRQAKELAIWAVVSSCVYLIVIALLP
jgi:hypothetical protein